MLLLLSTMGSDDERLTGVWSDIESESECECDETELRWWREYETGDWECDDDGG